MIIREVKVGDLPKFIKSREYRQLDIKPITPLRAISQFNNPLANKNDIALIYAVRKNILLGFVGLLPDLTNHEEQSRIYSNTGWWINKDHAKDIGLPLFLKAYQSCEGNMFLTDCTAYTKSILEKTGLFSFAGPVPGKRYFFRFYFSELLLKKTKSKLLSQVFALIDVILNLLIQLFKARFRVEIINTGYSLKSLKKIDENLEKFVKSHSKKFILSQSVKKLNWIIQYPWIKQSSHLQENYPFTSVVNSFNQEFLVIQKNKKTVALLLLSVRDKHAQIPYFYCQDEIMDDIVKLILEYLSKLKVNSLAVFNPELNKAFDNTKNRSIYKKELIKYTGFSTNLSNLAETKIFQDGEGDIAFT